MRGVFPLFSTILLFIPLFVCAACQRTCAEVLVGWPGVVTPPSIKGLSVTLFGHLLLIILHFLFIVFCYIFGDSCKYIWLLIDYL